MLAMGSATVDNGADKSNEVGLLHMNLEMNACVRNIAQFAQLPLCNKAAKGAENHI